MSGHVYIANISSSRATYTINGTPTDMPARRMDPSTYTPYFAIVGRSRYPSADRTFAMGENPFSAYFEDFAPPETGTLECVVTIPYEISLDDDLILYVFRNSAVLINNRGEVLKSFPGSSVANPP